MSTSQNKPGYHVTHVLDHPDQVWNIEISHCGRYLASVSGPSIFIWNMDTFALVKKLTGRSPTTALWSPDDSMILSGGRKQTRLLNVKTGESHIVKDDDQLASVWLPDGRFVISDVDSTMVWSEEGEVHRWEFSGDDLAVSGDKLVALSHNKHVKSGFKLLVYDLVTFDKLGEVKLSERPSSLTVEDSFALVNLIGTMTEQGGLHDMQLWDINTLQLVQRYTGNKPSAFVIRPCLGELVLSGSEDSRVYVWTREGGLIGKLEGHEKMVNAVKWNPKGGFVSAGDDGKVRIWEKI